MASVRTTFQLTVAAAPSYVSGLTVASAGFSEDFAVAAGLNDPLDNAGGTGSGPPAFNAPNLGAPAYTLMDWTGKSHFDSQRNEWWYCAGTTGSWPGSQTMIRYSVADNTFRHWQGLTYDDTVNSVFGSYGTSHNFDAAAFDPSRRMIFRNLRQAQRIGYWSVDTKSGGTWPMLYESMFVSMEAFPEIGMLIHIFHESSTTIRRYSMDDGTQQSNWTKAPQTNKAAVCYLGGYIYYTGDSGAWYRLDTSGNSVSMSSSPTPMSANGNDETHTILVPLNGYIYAFKLTPAATGRGVYRYDPTADEWIDTGTSAFPEMRAQKWIVGPLTSEGLVLLITSPATDFISGCHVWKP